METIIFNNNGISPPFKLTKELKRFLISIFKNEGVAFESVSYIFCRDDYLLALNQQFLKHDLFTDILTFTLSDTGDKLVSEIYISVDRVKDNADTLKINCSQEFLRVMIHGILHLCGYSDHSRKEKAIMRKKEDYYLSLWPFHVERST